MRKSSDVEKELTVTIGLGRTIGGGGNGWRLSVEDQASHLSILEVFLTDEQMGAALGGQVADIPGARYWANPNIGKRHEHVVILVPLNERDWPSWEDRENASEVERLAEQRAMKAIAAQYEAGYLQSDGWVPTVDTTLNRHRLSREGYQVSLRRYVDA
jgi:hypothetical protein